MKGEDENTDELTTQDFQNMINHISKKDKKKYQFILRAGPDFHFVLYGLFKKIWESEERPETWKNTTLIQLYKMKGSKFDFANQRFIHTKDDISKSFEHILVAKFKPKIMENCSKFQIGSIPSHRPGEHLFT